uniref:Uncharacterized protein n=1 Tax=Arundo donax TaxID=35708 RepID=A0A0A9GT37_ARUDO
MTKMLSAFQE